MSSSRPQTGRKIILCIDGTNDTVDATRTNVWRTYDALRNDPASNQVTEYQSGVGTFTNQNFMTKTANWVSLKLDSGFATYFEDHVSKGYKWLCDTYRDGDHIFLFGFSRGAHTVRCVAGMINKVGLVGRSSATDTVGFPIKDRKEGDKRERDISDDFIAKVYKLYCDESVKGIQQSTQLKKDCSITPNNPNIPIEFVGCWDTVASVGIAKSKHPPFAASNQIIHIFRHAFALDEHRARFNEFPWEQEAPDPKESSWFGWMKSKIGLGPSSQATDAKNSMKEGYEDRPETDVKEVWFAGCHADIGGGSVPTETPHTLGRITFRWMIRELRASTALDVLFDVKKLQGYGLYEYGSSDVRTASANGAPQSNGAVASGVQTSTTTTTQRGEKANRPSAQVVNSEDQDITSPVFDQLKIKPQWWVLEYLWFGKNIADADGTAIEKARWNRGQSRIVNASTTGPAASLQGGFVRPKVHYTAKRRQELLPDYVPRARFYVPGRKNPLDLSKADNQDWISGVEIVGDPTK